SSIRLVSSRRNKLRSNDQVGTTRISNAHPSISERSLQPSCGGLNKALMKIVFGEPDKMFRLIGEALAPSLEGQSFLKEFYLTECADPVGMLRAWSARRGIPSGITVAHCAKPEDLKTMLSDA